MIRGLSVWFVVVTYCASAGAVVSWPVLQITRPIAPPEWALLERALLRANEQACQEFYAKYFDQRGFLLCVERWGGDDGPDDAIENCNDWPVLHAVGASDEVLRMYLQAWEGHLRQFTLARTTQVPFARDGMYFKEFPCMFDWQHNNEGLLVFHQQGLSTPNDPAYVRRVRRYAGFYMNEDAGAANFDSEHQIIRSLFNGSRGPLLRKATALDWTGDPIDVENRFVLGHGERNYAEMLAHFQDYHDIVGDHPLNLLATSLALHAYLATGETKYRDWLLAYVTAWRQRMVDNEGVIPSNVGLDGQIGGACDGKWYGGTYGWGFTVTVPQTGQLAHRNRTHWGFTGFMNAYLLTGDDRFLEPWRIQRDVINGNGKLVNGTKHYPRMYGDDGWYDFQPTKYAYNDLELYYLSMQDDDRAAVGQHPWLEYLEGESPDYPLNVLRADISRVRRRVQQMRNDATTPDTRLSDDPMQFNPASVRSLRELILGGIDCGKKGSVLHCRLRYFDPVARRAGLSPDLAALIESMTSDRTVVQLVNTSQLQPRTTIIQAGGYAEHRFLTVAVDEQTIRVDAPYIGVTLAPGCGARLVLQLRRYCNQPTIQFPWERPGPGLRIDE